MSDTYCEKCGKEKHSNPVPNGWCHCADLDIGHEAYGIIMEGAFKANIKLQFANDTLKQRIEDLEAKLAQEILGHIEALNQCATLKLSRLDEECLRIGQQMQRAAGTLPEMFNIVIDVENGYGGVKLLNDNGDEFDFETDTDGLSYSIERAINAAILEGK